MFISPQFAQILKFLAQSCHRIIAALRNCGNIQYIMPFSVVAEAGHETHGKTETLPVQSVGEWKPVVSLFGGLSCLAAIAHFMFSIFGRNPCC